MLKTFTRLIVAALALIGLVTLAAGVWFAAGGIDARSTPGSLETAVARRLRAIAIPSAAVDRQNPVPAGAEALAEGMAHFADHCASCHANDGSGDTEMGRGLYPKPPDMRLAATQELSDGALFYIIEHGVRLTGMPGWGTGTPASETDSWKLVHFIRHLPKLTEAEIEEMKALNPKSASEWQEEEEIRKFLEGGGEKPKPTTPHKHGDHR